MLSQLKWNPCSEPCSVKIHRERMDHGKQVTENRFDYFLIPPSVSCVNEAGIHAVNVDRLRPLRGRQAGFKQ